MNIRFKDNLAAIWLIAALLSLTLPIFVPSFADAHGIFANVIEMATATMLVISLPTGLFGIGLVYLEILLGFDPNRIGMMYLNLWMFFALGILQWFVVVPGIFKKESRIQTLGLPQNKDEIFLIEARHETPVGFLDRELRTPIERVILDESRK